MLHNQNFLVDLMGTTLRAVVEDALRARLDRHIRAQLPDRSGGIATALVTGDQNAVGEEDAEAMRR